MRVKREQKLKDLQEEERRKQIEKGISPKFVELPTDIMEAQGEEEEEEGVKDMEEFRQMKFNKDDSANAVETKKSVGDFNPNYGVRVGEGRRFQKSKSKPTGKKSELNKDSQKFLSYDDSVQNESSPENNQIKPSARSYFTRRSKE